MTEGRPILWQLEISHYSEKVRWALDHKRVGHGRRSMLPGAHIAAALLLTGGRSVTLPILELDGRSIADSTAIIATLERRFPERPLYPTDPERRRRALELEEYFDEQLGPHVRRLIFHDMLGEPAVFDEVAARAVPGRLGEAERIIGAYARRYSRLRFGAGDHGAADAARDKVRAAMSRLDEELADGDGAHLVGRSFSVADLAGASMFYPLVGPVGQAHAPDQPVPAAFQALRDELGEHPGYRWVEDTYRRHRVPAHSSRVEKASSATA